MVIYLSQRFSSMLCLFIYFVHFFISFKHHFHIDAEIKIVKIWEMPVKKCMRR